MQTKSASDKTSISKKIVEGTRPWSLPMFVLVLMIGFLLGLEKSRAQGNSLGYLALIAALATIGELFMHSGTNIINDYYDYYIGIDTPEYVNNVMKRYHMAFDPLIGPVKMYEISIAMFISSGMIGVIIALLGRPLALALGVAGILLGYFYSAPPVKAKYRGLGDLFVILSMLILEVTGYYLSTGRLSSQQIIVGLPLAMLIDNVLLANNIRDLGRDSAAGVKTLALYLGDKASRFLYVSFEAAAYLVELAGVVIRVLPLTSLITLATLPLAYTLGKDALTSDLVGLDVKSAKLVLIFGVLSIIAIIPAVVMH